MNAWQRPSLAPAAPNVPTRQDLTPATAIQDTRWTLQPTAPVLVRSDNPLDHIAVLCV